METMEKSVPEYGICMDPSLDVHSTAGSEEETSMAAREMEWE